MAGEVGLFTCAICRREVKSWGGNHGPAKELSPICRYCEQVYGETAPSAGAFADRRKAVQVSALAEALRGEAGVKQWSERHGCA